MKTIVQKLSMGDRLFNVINITVMLLICLVVLYPLYFVVIASITDPNIVNRGGILLYPKELYLGGYEKILDYAPIWRGYVNTIIYTVSGTTLNIMLTISAGYVLSRKDLYGKNVLMFLFVFTMFFQGGLIPTYLLVSNLGMMNTVWAMILPTAASVFNIILARTFFQSTIPKELHEAAMIDGCSDLKFFFKIVIPLSKVIVAVMVLFYGVQHWNSFFEALIYLDSESRYPLQIVLRNLIIMNEASSISSDPLSMIERQNQAEQMKYGIIVIASLPMLVFYPFLQKYFAKGVMIGSVKG
ncbi:carbohydrate ABC transporter permease [Gracilibacillus alcaliphilus]|uniref:carbohydrate ABC transporter permease n=1 Tax=Gracilibacillus alcaliphilus TaxID=1401441 RepID=UPI001957680B|nr:carbohydrate ABC transporter permease [Gracilibacillus alcaliphilus]MBM7677748.1 putative aldouronate transport system permease protein [Gracilibacillus alcaliphilus]